MIERFLYNITVQIIDLPLKLVSIFCSKSMDALTIITQYPASTRRRPDRKNLHLYNQKPVWQSILCKLTVESLKKKLFGVHGDSLLIEFYHRIKKKWYYQKNVLVSLIQEQLVVILVSFAGLFFKGVVKKTLTYLYCKISIQIIDIL